MGSDCLNIVVHDSDTAVEEVRAAQLDGRSYLEIWVERSPAKLCSLFSGDRCFLMLLRHEGDAGFSSRNPEIAPDDTVMKPFALPNGQVDEYPLHWTYPSAVGWAALERFAETGRVPRAITWFNDSQDGAEPPQEHPFQGHRIRPSRRTFAVETCRWTLALGA